MPRISALTLDQLNRQFDTLDNLQKQIHDLQQRGAYTAQQTVVADAVHAPSTTNNLVFDWNGGAQTITWAQGFIKDKNWSAQTVSPAQIKSSAKSQVHIFTVPAGTLSAAPSTYYWIGWDPTKQVMLISTDASKLHGNFNVHVICQLFTGTAGQSSPPHAGGGGSQGGVDLSGARYKNF